MESCLCSILSVGFPRDFDLQHWASCRAAQGASSVVMASLYAGVLDNCGEFNVSRNPKRLSTAAQRHVRVLSMMSRRLLIVFAFLTGLFVLENIPLRGVSAQQSQERIANLV